MSGRLQAELKMSRPFASMEVEALLNLERTVEVLRHQVHQILRQHGLTQSGYNVLRILRGAGPGGWTCGEIAARMVVSDPDITRLIDRLVKLGLVQRSRGQRDRRQVHAEITPAGRDLCGRLEAPLLQLNRDQLAHLGPDRLRGLIDILEAIRVHLDASPPRIPEVP